MSAPDRRAMVERSGKDLSVRRQCVLLSLTRSGVYPGINLVRMHPVPLRQFRNRRILAQRLKRNLRLERRIKLLA